MITPHITNWFAADTFLNGNNARKLANNTYVERLDNGDIVIRLHWTRIVTFYNPNNGGGLSLNDGGFKTATTKRRINELLPDGLTLYADRKTWWIADRDAGTRYTFANVSRINDDRTISLYTF